MNNADFDHLTEKAISWRIVASFFAKIFICIGVLDSGIHYLMELPWPVSILLHTTTLIAVGTTVLSICVWLYLALTLSWAKKQRTPPKKKGGREPMIKKAPALVVWDNRARSWFVWATISGVIMCAALVCDSLFVAVTGKLPKLASFLTAITVGGTFVTILSCYYCAYRLKKERARATTDIS